MFEGKVGDPAATSNCIVNDLPTVVALHVLLERVLLLPSDVVPADEQAKWLAFQAILPPVPVTTENGKYKSSSLPPHTHTHTCTRTLAHTHAHACTRTDVLFDVLLTREEEKERDRKRERVRE